MLPGNSSFLFPWTDQNIPVCLTCACIFSFHLACLLLLEESPSLKDRSLGLLAFSRTLHLWLLPFSYINSPSFPTASVISNIFLLYVLPKRARHIKYKHVHNFHKSSLIFIYFFSYCTIAWLHLK